MSFLLLEILLRVDWTEPWLLCLLAFHLLTAITVFLLRRHIYIQAAILAFLALLCLFSETINEYAAMNYSSFSNEQYFDPNGVFILTVFSAPLLFNCFLIVVSWLWGVWHMMVRLGELKEQKRLHLARAKQLTRDPLPNSKQHSKQE